MPYNSENETALNRQELVRFIHDNNLFEEDFHGKFNPQDRYWPDDEIEADGHEANP
jgi:hypothetical protein